MAICAQEDEAAPVVAAQLHGRRLVRVGATAVEIGHVLGIAAEHVELAEVGASGVALHLIRVRARVRGQG